MAEFAPLYYRTQIILTLLGAVVMLGLCVELLFTDQTRASKIFAGVFLGLLLLAVWAVVRRLRKLKAEKAQAALLRK